MRWHVKMEGAVICREQILKWKLIPFMKHKLTFIKHPGNKWYQA